MKRKYVATGLLAGLVAGTGAGLVLEQSSFAGASNGLAAVAIDDSSTTTPATTPATTDTATTDPGSMPDRGDRVRDVLQPLVDDGTLTSAQLDAVVSALDAAGPMAGPMGEPGGPGGHGGPGDHRGPRGGAIGLDAAATALGITADELRTDLQGGSTIAAVATEQGVDVQTVIDAMVADATQHLADRVTAGDITQDEADAKIAGITERITDFVNNGRPERPAPTDAGSATDVAPAA